jgi:hypothetical protein
MSGYGNLEQRLHNRVLDPIYAICVAISDGENTVLLYHMDFTAVWDDQVADYRARLWEKYKIPGENLIFNTTHTHSAPAVQSTMDCIVEYKKLLSDHIIRAADLALADLEECGVSIGAGEVVGYNFVRRYLLSNGTYGGDNFGDFKNNTILGHETEADHQMQLIRLTRKTKKDILLVNWQGHPHLTGGSKKYDLSSDLIEHFRNTVEEEHGVLFSFYQGCGGNINHHSRMVPPEERPGHIRVGKALAAGLTPILSKMRPVKSGKIRAAMKQFTGPVNHDWDVRLEDARRIVSVWKSDAPAGTGTLLAQELGFNSVYHAAAVIKRSKMPETHSYNIGALSFGDVCLVWAPNELYDTTGIYLKATSPFEMTFVCGYTNGSHGYMPTIKAFAHGGYGCDNCRFGAGVTEKLTDTLLDQILKVKE